MNAYVDSSVVIRILFGEPNPLPSWSEIDRGVSSQLLSVECLRTLDRVRLRDRLDDRTVGERRRSILETIDAIEIVPLDGPILERAGDRLPTTLRTLDAIHLASALAIRDEVPDLVFATHDVELGRAASAMGFDVEGVDLAAQ